MRSSSAHPKEHTAELRIAESIRGSEVGHRNNTDTPELTVIMENSHMVGTGDGAKTCVQNPVTRGANVHAPLPPTVRRRALPECHSNNRVCLVRFHGCVCQHTSPDRVVPTLLRSFQHGHRDQLSTDKNRYYAGRVGMRTRNVCTVFLSNFVYHFF